MRDAAQAPRVAGTCPFFRVRCIEHVLRSPVQVGRARRQHSESQLGTRHILPMRVKLTLDCPDDQLPLAVDLVEALR